MTEFNLLDRNKNKRMTISFSVDYYDEIRDKEFILKVARKVYDLMEEYDGA